MENNIIMYLKRQGGLHRLDSLGSGYEPVASSCHRGN